MNKTQSLKAIREAFDRLHVLNNIKWCLYREQLFKLCREEEKAHRGCGPSFTDCHPDAIGVTDAAKLFAVHRIAQYLNGDKLPEVKDFLSYQRSAYMAAALVLNYREQIVKAWSDVDVPALATMDYVSLVRPKEAA